MNRFVVVPACYVFLLRDTPEGGRQVLLQLRRGTGFMDEHWAAAAAGHVERGETVFEAAAREAVEEVGVTGLDLAPWCAMQRTAPVARGTADPVDERVDYFFTATSWVGEPRIVEPEKCAALEWFALDALPDPVVPHEKQVLGTLRDGATPPVVTFGF
ncbi:MAG: NUDIX domain-containing protein [Nocardioides sp.]